MGPEEGYAGTAFFRHKRHGLILDRGLLPQLVNREGDRMPYPLGFDHGGACLTMRSERHGDQGFQRVPLGTPGWTRIGVARADAIQVIKKIPDGLGRDPASIIGNADFASIGRDCDVDLRRDPSFLALIDRLSSNSFKQTSGQSSISWP